MSKVDCSDYCLIHYPDFMVTFIVIPNSAKDGGCLWDGRLVDHYLCIHIVRVEKEARYFRADCGKSTFKSAIFLDMLTILCECGGADASKLTAG